MRILKVISLLLDYPDEALVEGREELEQAIIQAREISPQQRGALFELLELICSNDLMDGQEHYGALFGRGRSLSLLLFEHVHGESRDRGQAMVDMLAQYEAAGFVLGIKELPDYLPLYLEFLSTREDIEAREGLADVAHLLALLAARLEERESAYASCFRALLQIAGAEPQQAVAGLREQVTREPRDDSLEALDKVWEEEAVDFLKAEQQDRCSSMPGGPGKAREESAVPLHWVGFQHEGPAGEVGNV
ncbi:nitrate reductase molybdenum cofactor assembly chaperone [Pseudomonas capsici]|uniref:Nitrate reductase molybdenum cofactor assembly chaperone n=1 Tax=Pseudomonas capsici TaxID=2810614 RepID=A0ABT3BZH8_9PSED|nr:nitrate reductase molybdenum cofactor assembly chaperone [Pseudomonas capsici]MBN6715641.1 nitrate reductase molybdenum cofactor assembly chaperone [Pseudomonas capsici]MBN6720642.1 nitrate reductase molybdenum cofactor assembly chaperone [Pseudomonas capsici]MBN6725484.1 nitrate reductase molybdenum cofactor assembly chaperone [Pseudomonas capsici]MCV4266036.1 nitrate reductase molybdenum cofactor assembly chaperone [Pseudomonas capsici]MCV4277359.1 nitrate reductase molybdenum cofactor as